MVLLGPLMTSLDSTVVNVSLATLGHELHVPLTAIQWVMTGYLLALALTLPLSGWLVDRIGAKRVYLCCFTAFTLASLLCGLATSAAVLIGARELRGMAGGLLAPMAQMMVARGAGNQVAKVMGIMVVPVLLGPICGPTLAGTILQHASWRWIFFINLPIGILATALAAWILPRDRTSLHARSFDLRGFLLLSPGLVLLLYSLEELGADSAAGQLCLWELAVSICLLAAFAVHAMRCEKRRSSIYGSFGSRYSPRPCGRSFSQMVFRLAARCYCRCTCSLYKGSHRRQQGCFSRLRASACFVLIPPWEH